MRPRLTWKVRQWSEGSLAPQNPAIRTAYGDDCADVIETFAAMVADRRDQPSGQDIKRTLQAIESAPAAADLTRLDGQIESALLEVAWKRFRVADVCTLPHEQLASCARDALLVWRKPPGAPQIDDLAMMLVAQLLKLRPALPAAHRNQLIDDALKACRLGSGAKSVARLLSKVNNKAGRVL